MGDDDEEGARGMEPQRRRDKGGRRAPGAIDDRTATILQGGDDGMKTLGVLDEAGDVFESVGA
jgi:hypothetical protein